MTKKIYCEGCFVVVAFLEIGSKIKTGSVMLCENCEHKRKMSDLSNKSKPQMDMPDIFKDLFGGKF